MARDQALAKISSTRLSGWGANVRVNCRLLEPETPTAVALSLDRSGSIPRGLGRSYGDAALNSNGQVLGIGRLNRYLGFDGDTGTLICESGASLADIIRDFSPRGWFPMVTPGTKYVTVGGCIASDVHGKAHHSQGTFSNCIDELLVLLADGRQVTASRTENEELFWATFGGMGLLGIVLTAKMRLRRIDTTYFRQKCVVARNLEEMLDALEEYDQVFPYSVATLDVFATGKHLGRGVLVGGDHASREDLPNGLARRPLMVSGPPTLNVPFQLPAFTLNRLTVRVLNSIIQRIQSRIPMIGHYDNFLYPLDGISNWNRAYGPSGFTQYQFVIPFSGGLERMRRILSAIVTAGELPFLNVLKRFGKQSGGLLSFPQEGYTFAIDLPIRKGTIALLRRLDDMVLDSGGRVYLAKDSYLAADTFRSMYPAVRQWLGVKAKYDPMGVFTSDLARRLELLPPLLLRQSD